MDRRERDQTPNLEVEVAKLRLRVAAEKAEPARLLRQQAVNAPLPTFGTALLAGLLLGRRSKAGSGLGGTGLAGSRIGSGPLIGGDLVAGLLSQALSLVSRAAGEWRR